AAGWLGPMVMAFATQAVLSREPWQIGALFFVLLAIAMLPAAFLAGGADRIAKPGTATISMREVLGQAMRNRPFLVMSGAYFVCGLNLMFVSTHLPAYLAICGQDPMLSAGALATIRRVSALRCAENRWRSLPFRRRRRPRLAGHRLARRPVPPAYPAGPALHAALGGARRLFRAAADGRYDTPIRGRNGHAVVARSRAADRRHGRRVVRHPLHGDAARHVLRRAP